MPAAENPIHRWDILVIESDQDTIDALREIIGPELKAAWAGSALEGGNFLRRHDVRVVVCADDLPDLPGLMFFAETRNLWPTTQRVLMCSDLDADLLLHTMREGGILNCLPKPLNREATEHLIEHALRQSRLMESLITMACAWISPDRNQVQHASAGHLPCLLQKTDGAIVQIDGAGMPLGIFHDSAYASHSIGFHPGERFLLYTDGIVEAAAGDGSMFELEGLKSCLAGSKTLRSRPTIDHLLNEVAIFSGNETPSDDRTAVLISQTN